MSFIVNVVLLFLAIVIGFPTFWLMNRNTTRKTLERWKKDSDDLTRKMLRGQTDYEIVMAVKLGEEFPKCFGFRFVELARDEARARDWTVGSRSIPAFKDTR